MTRAEAIAGAGHDGDTNPLACPRRPSLEARCNLNAAVLAPEGLRIRKAVSRSRKSLVAQAFRPPPNSTSRLRVLPAGARSRAVIREPFGTPDRVLSEQRRGRAERGPACRTSNGGPTIGSCPTRMRGLDERAARVHLRMPDDVIERVDCANRNAAARESLPFVVRLRQEHVMHAATSDGRFAFKRGVGDVAGSAAIDARTSSGQNTPTTVSLPMTIAMSRVMVRKSDTAAARQSPGRGRPGRIPVGEIRATSRDRIPS